MPGIRNRHFQRRQCAGSQYPGLHIACRQALLQSAPTEIRLVFSDATYLVSLSVMNAEGIDVLQAFEPAPEGASSFTVDLPASLEQGLYHVSWAVVGDDTHRVPGEFSFSVNAEAE